MSPAPNPFSWIEQLIDIQRKHLDATAKMIEAGKTSLDPENVGEAKRLAKEAADEAAEAQWAWMQLWQWF